MSKEKFQAGDRVKFVKAFDPSDRRDPGYIPDVDQIYTISKIYYDIFRNERLYLVEKGSLWHYEPDRFEFVE